jgi:putative transposase
MPRLARVAVPEVALHVVQRGHDGDDCFFQEGDYLAYLDLLRTCSQRFECSVHAYCLMTNHVHLFLTPHAEGSCASMMKFVSQAYVQRINKRLQRSGTLWEGRFYSCPVGSEFYALACYRYIELNPVDAGMVPHARDYPWSSYRVNAQGVHHELLAPHPAYEALAADAAKCGAAYAALFDTPLEPKVIDEIRKATRRGYMVGARRRPRGRPSPSVMRKMGSVPI